MSKMIRNLKTVFKLNKAGKLAQYFIGVFLLLPGFQPPLCAQTPAPADTTYTFVKTPIFKLVVPAEQESEHLPQLLVHGVRQGTVRTISLIVQNVQSGSFSIDSAKKVSIYIEDGTEMALSCGKSVYSTFGGMSFGNYVSADYPVSAYDLAFFKDYAVGNISIAYSGGIFEFRLNKAQSDVFKEMLELIK